MAETESAGVSRRVNCQPMKAVWIVVASIISMIIISLHGPRLEVRSRLRWKKCTSTYGAGVIVVKPRGDAVRADKVVAWEANLALDDTGSCRERADLLQAYHAALPIIRSDAVLCLQKLAQELFGHFEVVSGVEEKMRVSEC